MIVLFPCLVVVLFLRGYIVSLGVLYLLVFLHMIYYRIYSFLLILLVYVCGVFSWFTFLCCKFFVLFLIETLWESILLISLKWVFLFWCRYRRHGLLLRCIYRNTYWVLTCVLVVFGAFSYLSFGAKLQYSPNSCHWQWFTLAGHTSLVELDFKCRHLS